MLVAASAVLIVRFLQLWAIAAVLWLPLTTLPFRWTTGWLKNVFDARDDDVLVTNGVHTSPAPRNPAGERLANIAEEIAIATGGSQPEVAICQSQGINAFIAYLEKQGRKNIAVVFTSAMVSKFNRHELQAVVAHLYSHGRNFEQMLITMVGAMYVAVFAAADVFLILTTLNWNYGGSGDFSTGPLVVMLVMGMLYGPVLASGLAQVLAMRHSRFYDDLKSLEISHDPESLISALEKISDNSSMLEASYDMSNAHFYFDAVRDPARRYPWQKLTTHPRPVARIKALQRIL